MFLDINSNFKMCGDYHSPRRFPPSDPLQKTYGEAVYYFYPLDRLYSSYNYMSNLTSNRFLCNIHEWIQGDYIDSAGMADFVGIGL